MTPDTWTAIAHIREGKATVARNAYRGATWLLLRDLARALREQRKLLPR